MEARDAMYERLEGAWQIRHHVLKYLVTICWPKHPILLTSEENYCIMSKELRERSGQAPKDQASEGASWPGETRR